MTDLADQKAAARKAGFARRKQAHGSVAAPSGMLSSVLAGHRGVPLAGYSAMRTEIDPSAALAEAAAYGPVGLPVITGAGQPLQFREWTPGCEMAPGAMGADIPASGSWITPQIVIVPLVAFTRAGGRLGYGGGFYDRTLERLRMGQGALAIGFAYSAQEADSLPLEDTDQPLDMIVTEAGVIDCGG